MFEAVKNYLTARIVHHAITMPFVVPDYLGWQVYVMANENASKMVE